MSRHQRTLRRPEKSGSGKAIPLLLALGLLAICLPGLAQEEGEKEAIFRGVGIHIKLRGAWITFSGGDIDKGTAGMYDRMVAEVTSGGFELAANDKKNFRSGYELTGDVVYYFTPAIGIGLGGSLVRSHQESTCLFHWPDSRFDYRLTGLPEVRVLSLRLGLFYALPISRLLSFCVSAGPEYHFADYDYSGTLTTPYSESALVQETDARKLGIYGSLSLEIRMNRRLAFIIEAFGRYAKISGFEGKEVSYEWLGGQSTTINEQGTLYFYKEGGYSRLDIIPAGTAGGQAAREAVFDLSGVSLQAGFNFKF